MSHEAPDVAELRRLRDTEREELHSGGWETVAAADGVQWPRIPVTVECDEGVVIAPIAPQPTPEWGYTTQED